MHERLTAEDLRFTPPELPADRLLPFLQRHWGVTGDLKPLSGERDQNFRLTTSNGERYVLKIASPIEDAVLIDFQVRALLHIEHADPDLPVPRLVRSSEGNPTEVLHDESGVSYVLRLLTYVFGQPLSGFPAPPTATIRQIGRLQGRLCRALGDFSHPGEDHFMPWDILNDLVVSEDLRRNYLPARFADRCAPVFERLADDALPRMHRLPAQVIHNDGHSGNVMCNPDDPRRITGVIDFGDLIRRPLLVDLAVSLVSLIDRDPDAPGVTRALLDGFESVMPVPDEQLPLLLHAMLARSILTVQLLHFRLRNTDCPRAPLEDDLAIVMEGLNTLLDIEPDRFLRSIRAGR